MAQTTSQKAAGGAIAPFNLLRWYSLSSLVVVVAVAIVFAYGFTRFIARETLQRDAVLTAQFINSMSETETEHAGFRGGLVLPQLLDPRIDPVSLGIPVASVRNARSEFYDHIRLLPDLLLANVYASDMRIIWSTNPVLIGKVDADNDDLKEAFRSRVLVAIAHLETAHDKEEQRFLSEPKSVFIENYIPLRNGNGDVVLTVEVYKEPASLLATMTRADRLVWGASALAAAAVYLTGFGIVRRGQLLLLKQQRRLVETETLVAIGEMSTAVAHSLRNPLATIRSSAELALDTESEAVRKNARDIISQVDRMSGWVRDLLRYSRPQEPSLGKVDLPPLLRDAVAGFAQQIDKAGIRVNESMPEMVPPVAGDTSLLPQVFRSVLSNAVEAMPEGGELRVLLVPDDGSGRVVVTISDSGQGMSPEQLAMAFRPFHTSKRQGLGLGLSLVKQVMERLGGSVEIASRENVGTDVRLVFQAA